MSDADPAEQAPPDESLAALIDRLVDEGHVSLSGRREIAEAFDTKNAEERDPWYVQAVSGLGAWLAAMTFVGFLGCSGSLDFDGPLAFVVGGAALALGVVVHHVWREADIFFNQLALAASLVGQVVLVGAMWQQLGLPAAAGVYGTAVVVPLFLLFRGGVHRFLSTLAALTLGSAAFVDLGLPAGQTVLFGAELLVVALVFAGRGLVPLRWRVPLRPLGYAATVTAVWTSSELFLLDYLKLETLALHSGLVAAVLVYLAYEAVREGGTKWLEAAFWGGGAAVALSVVSTPGLLVGMVVLFLGIWRGETALGALGVVALGYYLWAFYYSLEMTLLGKSAVLVASGLVLLALRAWFALRPWTPDGPAGEAPKPEGEGAR